MNTTSSTPLAQAIRWLQYHLESATNLAAESKAENWQYAESHAEGQARAYERALEYLTNLDTDTAEPVAASDHVVRAISEAVTR